MLADILGDMGITPVRRINGRGGLAPHTSLQFDSHLFSIDTSRSPQSGFQPDAYLITHAHSDHFGKSAMLSPTSIASRETARALEIRYDRSFRGRIFDVGDMVEVAGVKVRTYPTRHTIGSSAFYWETEVGTRILVTGDVKDYRELPPCDLLVMEANYGDPWDSTCIFEDDLAGFWEALSASASFGAYAFGKAQRAVSLMRGMGFKGEIGMDPQSLALTRELLPGAGPLTDFHEETETRVVTPQNLGRLTSGQKFLLTGRREGGYMGYNTLCLSDHLDFRGLMRMIEHVHPKACLAYHPAGPRTKLLAHYLRQRGMEALSLEEVKRVVR